jgi:hypothetical protein
MQNRSSPTAVHIAYWSGELQRDGRHRHRFQRGGMLAAIGFAIRMVERPRR